MQSLVVCRAGDKRVESGLATGIGADAYLLAEAMLAEEMKREEGKPKKKSGVITA